MELRMHRYFKKNENIIRVKKYLAECSVGDWFVLYQMSKNMNKRLFFDFLTSLAQVSRSDVLQVSKLIVHTHIHKAEILHPLFPRNRAHSLVESPSPQQIAR